MNRPARCVSSDAAPLALAVLACLPAVVLPIHNPDVFWHLSAARRMLELRALPSADWLSRTMAGAPWTDFEWLSELVYAGAYGLGGLGGLWALKAVLVAGGCVLLLKTLAAYGLSRFFSSAALAAWGAGMLVRADIRPDLFSLLGFAWLFKRLEARRLGGGDVRPAWLAPFFAVWANLHAGFIYGLLLLFCYAAAETFQGLRPRRLWQGAAAAAFGCCLNPAGARLFAVPLLHWKDMGALSRGIAEWGPVGFGNPWRWPHWLFLTEGFAALGACLLRRKKIPAGPAAALLYLGYAGTVHARLGAYHAVIAVPLAVHLLRKSGFLPERPGESAKRAALAFIAACLVFSLYCSRQEEAFFKVFQDRYHPVKAADFLAAEAAVLGGRPLYNTWEAGGYLGWRLYPAYRVFQDGRYIFHPFLAEAERAVADQASWAAFMDRRRIEVALMPNIRLRFPSIRRYPDGARRSFDRPYYVYFMPREAWALVYWDENSLLFVRRAAMVPSWLKAHEYRYLHPGDREALGDALSRGEVPAADVEAENLRHAAEMKEGALTSPRPSKL